MFAGLSLDQAPPIKAPMKFFMSAPLLSLIASIFAIFLYLNPYMSDPVSIGFLHVVTIGFMVFVLFGALLQMLPVVAGAVVKNVEFVANFTFFSLLGGLALFFTGFVFTINILLYGAFIFIVIGVLFFLYSGIKELLKVEHKSYIVKGIIISLYFLFIGVLIGLFLTYSHASQNIIEFHYNIVYFHKVLIYFGTMFMMISAISFQVIPMFWVSQSYSEKEQKIVLYGILIGILLTLFSSSISQFTLSLVSFYYIVTTYKKLKSRKRKIKDHSVEFWYISLLFLLFATLSWSFYPQGSGIFFGAFVIFVMVGMLYKIVPFLVWFHLSSKGIFDIPSMKEMIPSKMIEFQKATLVLSFVGMFFKIYQVSYILFALTNAVLFINLLISYRIFYSKTSPDLEHQSSKQ